jgi:hypothetical protein
MKPKNLLIGLAAIASFVGVFLYLKKRSDNAYAATVENNPDIEKGKAKPKKKYVLLTKATAKKLGEGIAHSIMNHSATETEKNLLYMLHLQKPSFLQVYWYASQALFKPTRKDLIDFLQAPTMSSSHAASVILAVCEKVITGDKRYTSVTQKPYSPATLYMASITTK